MKPGTTQLTVTETAQAYGDAIYELRVHKDRRWSQRDLARVISTSNSVVCQWERGCITPTRRSIDKLCQAFGMTCAEFKQRVAVCRRDIRRKKQAKEVSRIT